MNPLGWKVGDEVEITIEQGLYELRDSGAIDVVEYKPEELSQPKQKEEVELKNLIIEEKQKEILDSIHYAKRIQFALLPSVIYIQKSLKRLTSC